MIYLVKNVLISFNLILLLIGNVLFTEIHHLHDDTHSQESNKNECETCEYLKYSNNFDADSQGVYLLNNNIDHLFIDKCSNAIEKSCKGNYLTRAPPLSS